MSATKLTNNTSNIMTKNPTKNEHDKHETKLVGEVPKELIPDTDDIEDWDEMKDMKERANKYELT